MNIGWNRIGINRTYLVTVEFRNYVLDKYPILKDKAGFRRLFGYLCFSSFYSKKTKRLVITTKSLSEMFGHKNDNHFNGLEKLEWMRDNVLPDLTWSKPDFIKGKAREIITNGFDEEMKLNLDKELLSSNYGSQVDFIWGQKPDHKDSYKKELESNILDLQTFSLNEDQKKILNYIRSFRNGSLILEKVAENANDIEKAIGQLKPYVQMIQRRIIKSIYANPEVYYLPSPWNKTCRLFPQGESIAGLKKEIRKISCKGLLEIDLQCSQFAILSNKLEAPLSLELLSSGKTLWRSFYQHTHNIDAEPPANIKKIYKKAIYSLCFGQKNSNLQKYLNENKIDSLFIHPIMQELITKRDTWFAKIIKEGGCFDAWGKWENYELVKRTERSVAASVIRSYEMKIIAPIFEVAKRSNQFKIILFQFDGATIYIKDPKNEDSIKNELKNVVELKAKLEGINTVLEFEQL